MEIWIEQEAKHRRDPDHGRKWHQHHAGCYSREVRLDDNQADRVEHPTGTRDLYAAIRQGGKVRQG